MLYCFASKSAYGRRVKELSRFPFFIFLGFLCVISIPKKQAHWDVLCRSERGPLGLRFPLFTDLTCVMFLSCELFELQSPQGPHF